VLGTTSDYSGVFCLATWSNDIRTATPANKAEIEQFQRELVEEGIVLEDGETVLIHKKTVLEPVILAHLRASQTCARTAKGNLLFEQLMGTSRADSVSKSYCVVNMDREDAQAASYYDSINFNGYLMNNPDVSCWNDQNAFLLRPSLYRKTIEQRMAKMKNAATYPEVYKSRDAWKYYEQQKKEALQNRESTSLKSQVQKGTAQRVLGWELDEADEKENQQETFSKDVLAAAMANMKKKQPTPRVVPEGEFKGEQAAAAGPSDDDLMALIDSQPPAAPIPVVNQLPARSDGKRPTGGLDGVDPDGRGLGLLPSSSSSSDANGRKRKGMQPDANQSSSNSSSSSSNRPARVESSPLKKQQPKQHFNMYKTLCTAQAMETDEKKKTTPAEEAADEPVRKKLRKNSDRTFGSERDVNGQSSDSDMSGADEHGNLAGFVVNDDQENCKLCEIWLCE
jgi:hypothetical protein